MSVPTMADSQNESGCFDPSSAFQHFDAINWGIEDFDLGNDLLSPAKPVGDEQNLSAVAAPTSTSSTNSSPNPQQPTNANSQRGRSITPVNYSLRSQQVKEQFDHGSFPNPLAVFELPPILADGNSDTIVPTALPCAVADKGKLGERNNHLRISSSAFPSAPFIHSPCLKRLDATPQYSRETLKLFKQSFGSGNEGFDPSHFLSITNDIFFDPSSTFPQTISAATSVVATSLQSSIPSASTAFVTSPATAKSSPNSMIPPGTSFDIDNRLFADDFMCSSSSKTSPKGYAGVTSSPPRSDYRKVESSPLSGLDRNDTRGPIPGPSLYNQSLPGSAIHNIDDVGILTARNDVTSKTQTPSDPLSDSTQFNETGEFDFDATLATNHREITGYPPLQEDSFLDGIGFSYVRNDIEGADGWGRSLYSSATSRRSLFHHNQLSQPQPTFFNTCSVTEDELDIAVSKFGRQPPAAWPGPQYPADDHTRKLRPQKSQLQADQTVNWFESSPATTVKIDGKEYTLPAIAPPLTPTFAPSEGPHGYAVMPTRPDVGDATVSDSSTRMRIPAIKPPTKAAQAAQAAAARKRTRKTTITRSSAKSPDAFKNASRIKKGKNFLPFKQGIKFPRPLSIPPDRMAEVAASATKNGGFIPCVDGSMARFTVDGNGDGKVWVGYKNEGS